jgi:glycine/D-amino acid oxidase-like deaminating enzyme
MDRRYDLVVVGTGVTSAVASRRREAGSSVAVVDRQPFGGTCALRGCVLASGSSGVPGPSLGAYVTSGHPPRFSSRAGSRLVPTQGV